MWRLYLALLCLGLLAGCERQDQSVSSDVAEPVPVLEAPPVLPSTAVAQPVDDRGARWRQLEAMPVEMPEVQRPARQPLPVVALPDGPAQLAIIIDDVGHSLEAGRRLIRLPVPLTLAILPHTRFASQLAEEALAAGHEVMLHQPMENGAGSPIGPGGLYSHMSDEQLRQVLTANLDSLPHASGVNNHMGSRLTAERRAMDALMPVLRERGLFFIDSRTTAETQAAFAAEAAGVQQLSRSGFLDHRRDAGLIAGKLAEAVDTARQQGWALMIGHPYEETLQVLERELPNPLAGGQVELVPLQQLLQRHAR